MEKILVTTDFSTHSKAGLRFAVQLSAQKKMELVFFHCYQAVIPTSLHEDLIKNSLHEQTHKQMGKLKNFIDKFFKSMKVTPGKHKLVVVEDLSPEEAILRYAHNNDIDYICMSTRGAGPVMKIIGTNTGIVVVKSSVPVLVVPHTYRARPIKKILYSSDGEHVNDEMAKVAAFAQRLGVGVDLVHLYFPGTIPLEKETLAAMWKQKHPCLDRVFLEQFQLDKGFAAQLSGLVKKINPSIVVFFTQTNRTWFDKLFRVGRSEGFSFVTKKPMLVFRKGQNQNLAGA